MEFVRIINKKITQVFDDENHVKLEGIGVKVNPKVISLEKWKGLSCYPVIQPNITDPNYQELSEVFWDNKNKRAWREIVWKEIDIEAEKEELISVYEIEVRMKHSELNIQDLEDLRKLGYISEEQEEKHKAVTDIYKTKCKVINDSLSLQDLMNSKCDKKYKEDLEKI